MDIDLNSLARVLEATLDPTTNKQAELALLQEEKRPGFSIALLHIVAADRFPSNSRLASALYFKNFIRKTWTDEEGHHRLPEDEVNSIKSELIGLMISVSPQIQYQLGDAVGVIADSDFWERWDTLVDDLVSRLSPENASINNGVLQVAHSIFKRWRPLYRSDGLFTEINHVLSKFGTPFLNLLESTNRMIDQNQADKKALVPYFSTLNLVVKLFYDLSVQDLPPIFEDNLPGLVSLLLKYLTYDNKLLHSDEASQAGPLEHVKAGIFEILTLFVQKYEDAFGDHVSRFVETSWNLLTATDTETKNDILVSKALQFLTSVTSIQQHAQNFNDEATLNQVIERVILPNVTLRESDVELFEDEPIEFIRRDLEGSDNDTRRRAATDFLRNLMTQFPQLVTRVVLKYIDLHLADYAKNPATNWKSKDTAVYLFSSVAVKGTVTASQGAKSTNEFVDIIDFLQKNVAEDLISDVKVEAILKVDAIKYLYIFRSHISKTEWQGAFSLLVKHLGSPDYVVHTYAAIAIERVLALQDDHQQPVINPADVRAVADQLLQHLLQLIEKDKEPANDPEPAKLQENEFLMRCIMRVLIVVRDIPTSLLEKYVPRFIAMTDIISKNPSNPRFYYYHFEAIGAILRFADPKQLEKFEHDLYTPFASILSNDIQEIVPYVFQLLAALLEANPSGTLPPYYQSLIGPIISPQLYTMKGNIPALIRLLTSIILRGASIFVQNNQLEPLLAVFQQLTSTKSNEIYGFELLECIVATFPKNTLTPYFPTIIQVLLLRLENSKTDTFTTKFTRFYHFVSNKVDSPEPSLAYSSDFFIQVCEGIQSGVFTPLYLKVILPTTLTLLRPHDRRLATFSWAKTITRSQAFFQKYKKGWGFTVEALLKLLENPPVPPASTGNDEIIMDHDTDDMAFGVGFTQLQTIRKVVRDEWAEVRDVKQWAREWLKSEDQRMGGVIGRTAQERLEGAVREGFRMYLSG